MKAKCVTNRSGYEGVLKKGEFYEITDIQDSIFPDAYYAIGIGEEGIKFTCHLYRFDITKEVAEAYVVKHHSDWREKNNASI